MCRLWQISPRDLAESLICQLGVLVLPLSPTSCLFKVSLYFWGGTQYHPGEEQAMGTGYGWLSPYIVFGRDQAIPTLSEEMIRMRV